MSPAVVELLASALGIVLATWITAGLFTGLLIETDSAGVNPLKNRLGLTRTIIIYPYLLLIFIGCLLINSLIKNPIRRREEAVFKYYFDSQPSWVNPDFFVKQKEAVDKKMRLLAVRFREADVKLKNEGFQWYSTRKEAEEKYNAAEAIAKLFGFSVESYDEYLPAEVENAA